MPARYAVILNTRSGPTRRSVPEIEAALRAESLGASVVSAHAVEEITQLVGDLVRAGHSVVVAAGGDGTVSAVASEIAGTEVVLGILPLGSRNHFARDVGIPSALPDAVRVLATGQTSRVDIGEVNGRTFVNNVSLGLYPSFVRERGDARRGSIVNRWIATFVAVAKVFARPPMLRARLRIDGNTLSRITPFVFIGNNECIVGGPRIGSRLTVSGGCLSLIVTQRRGPWGLCRLAVRATLGTLREAKDLDILSGKEIEVWTKWWWAPLAIDGEVVTMEMPLRCAIRPGALRLLVPPVDYARQGL